LLQMFRWERHTPFAFPVVPEVKISILVSSGSIGMVSASVFPFAYSSAPFAISV